MLENAFFLMLSAIVFYVEVNLLITSPSHQSQLGNDRLYLLVFSFRGMKLKYPQIAKSIKLYGIEFHNRDRIQVCRTSIVGIQICFLWALLSLLNLRLSFCL
jgi:hypothetical protein